MQPEETRRSVFISSGQVFAHREHHFVTTVLGSCVAVCLWDSRRKIGGMNHYMLPRWDGKGKPTPRFGNVAIPTLLDLMEAIGARRGDLIAKVFGGGNVFGSCEVQSLNVGTRNAEYALEALEKARVTVVAAKVCTAYGLKVGFDTASGEVLVRFRGRTNSPAATSLPK